MTVMRGVFAALGTCTLLLAGCSSVPKTPARLYDLDNGRVVKLELYHLQNGHGRVTGLMPGGTLLEGKYTLAPRAPSDEDTGVKAGQNAADTGWALKYGYTRESQQQPLGSGTLSNETGYTLRFVLYNIDTATGYGTGLGQDSNGIWYRLHVGRRD